MVSFLYCVLLKDVTHLFIDYNVWCYCNHKHIIICEIIHTRSFIGHHNKGSFLSSPVDSAIGTGLTTENHSVIGENDDLDQLPDDIAPPNTTIIPNQQQQQGGMMMGGNPSSYSGHHYPDPHSLG